MPRSAYWRRPRAGSLRSLYDEGVAAAARGDTCPQMTGHGAATREHFWTHGFEDESDRQSVEALV